MSEPSQPIVTTSLGTNVKTLKTEHLVHARPKQSAR
jgi:hypothetical protein